MIRIVKHSYIMRYFHIFFRDVIQPLLSSLTLFRVFSSRNGFTRARVAWTYSGAERKCIALNRAGNRPRKAVIRFRRAAAPSAPPCRNENPLQSTTATKPDCWKKEHSSSLNVQAACNDPGLEERVESRLTMSVLNECDIKPTAIQSVLLKACRGF